ncbi:alanine dehydrogenase [Sneathiella chinensis]|uniref:Saccharopine dehydrogenase [NAD(+), L-lysine-forming] n=1 Tax=Sneathiella chinensis TaxID=349750 RepID=A0ABQ5U076_9PROT|nr:NAD(P)-dependent oxidoreductase [Sneathiella chinensis]GLQ05228.1 alanine dehydrogenase [Sneathiella chinensis]
MKIGVPTEIKSQEGRVALLPPQVSDLTARGHDLYVQAGAGRLSGANDADYQSAGAQILESGEEVFKQADLIVKVKEILPPEFPFLEKRHILLTNIHSANDRPQLDRLLEVGLIAIAAEDTHEFGSPNCPLAGEVGAFEGVRLTLAPHGGTGRHFMAHFGAPATKAVVLGLGQVGRGALRTLISLGLDVTGLDIHPGARKQAELDWHHATYRSGEISDLPDLLPDMDLVVNCVLWPKHRDDHLISRADLARMKPTAVIVDISCDEAGAVETSRPTSWADPVYSVDGIRHFCVDNIPGAVPATSSAGYAAALLPHIRAIAEHGPLEACRRNGWLARGLTCINGILTHDEAARVQKRDHVPAPDYLKKA